MRNRLHILLPLLIIGFVFGACKTDKTNDLFGENEVLQQSADSYAEAPDPQKANVLLKELMLELGKTPEDKDRQIRLLEYGYKISEEQNLDSRKAAFLYPLVKLQADSAGNADRIYELALLMKKLNKETASNTLFQGLLDNYPEFEKKEEIRQEMTMPLDTIETFIDTLGREIFKNPDQTGINRQAALRYVDAIEAFGIVYSDHPQTPDYLFRAAEVAKSIRTYAKSLSLYDWIIERYPNYSKAPTALFLKGFIIENNVGDDAEAKKHYEEFLAKYPDHDLADDVEFLIENLGKSDEEILEMIEKRRKEQEIEQ